MQQPIFWQCQILLQYLAKLEALPLKKKRLNKERCNRQPTVATKIYGCFKSIDIDRLDNC